jgi:hypothetical protein
MRFQFFADDGSSVSVTTIGEGMDSGDKSSNKAMSAALKYALVQMFCIPTADDKDSENDSHEVAPAKKDINFSVHPSNGKSWKVGSDNGLIAAYKQLSQDYQNEIGKVLTERGYVFADGTWSKPISKAPIDEPVGAAFAEDPHAAIPDGATFDDKALPFGDN